MDYLKVKETFHLKQKDDLSDKEFSTRAINEVPCMSKGMYELFRFKKSERVNDPYEVMFVEYRNGILHLNNYQVSKSKFEKYCEVF
jgi:hypothetical protein